MTSDLHNESSKSYIATGSPKVTIFWSHSFIGEESVSAGEPCNLTDNPTWIIDPIDGTTSFVHR